MAIDLKSEALCPVLEFKVSKSSMSNLSFLLPFFAVDILQWQPNQVMGTMARVV
jgi:hypothetical protein